MNCWLKVKEMWSNARVVIHISQLLTQLEEACIGILEQDLFTVTHNYMSSGGGRTSLLSLAVLPLHPLQRAQNGLSTSGRSAQ
jgi:hypothetical protein